jgi:hypothetical protein
VGWSLSWHLPPLCQPIWCGVGLLHHGGGGGGGFIDEVINLLLVLDFFHPLMWQTKGRSSDLYVRYQKGFACFGEFAKGGREKGSSTLPLELNGPCPLWLVIIMDKYITR